MPVLEKPIVESTVITDAPSPTKPTFLVLPGTLNSPSVRDLSSKPVKSEILKYPSLIAVTSEIGPEASLKLSFTGSLS